MGIERRRRTIGRVVGFRRRFIVSRAISDLGFPARSSASAAIIESGKANGGELVT